MVSPVPVLSQHNGKRCRGKGCSKPGVLRQVKHGNVLLIIKVISVIINARNQGKARVPMLPGKANSRKAGYGGFSRVGNLQVPLAVPVGLQRKMQIPDGCLIVRIAHGCPSGPVVRHSFRAVGGYKNYIKQQIPDHSASPFPHFALIASLTFCRKFRR